MTHNFISDETRRLNIRSPKQGVFLYYTEIQQFIKKLKKEKPSKIYVRNDRDHFNKHKSIVTTAKMYLPNIQTFLNELDTLVQSWSDELGTDLNTLIKKPRIIENVRYATYRHNPACSVDSIPNERTSVVYEAIKESFEANVPLVTIDDFELLKTILSNDYEHQDRLRSLRKTGTQYLISIILNDNTDMRINVNKAVFLIGERDDIAPTVNRQSLRRTRSDAGQREIIFTFEGGYLDTERSKEATYIEPLTLFLTKKIRIRK